MKPFSTSFYLFVFLLCIVMGQLHAQQNGSFENWSPSGSPPPFDWKFPTGWTTNNATTEFITAGVTRSTYHYSGEFAAQIKTLNIFGTFTRSQLALGSCTLDYPHYQIKPNTGGEALSMVPYEVSFFYQLTTGDPSEYAVADILIKRPSGSSVPNIVFQQTVPLQAVGIYTEMNIPIPKNGLNILTDSIMIVFSSNDTNEIAANILFVDDVSIDFVSSNEPTPVERHEVSIYPNPLRSGEQMKVVFPDNKFHEIKIMDCTGKIIERATVLNSMEMDGCIRSRNLPAGIYCLITDNTYTFPFVVIE